MDDKTKTILREMARRIIELEKEVEIHRGILSQVKDTPLTDDPTFERYR
jgi:hypothetical protein